MKKILLIIFSIFFVSMGRAEAEAIFQPQKIDNLWYAWTGYNGPNTDIFCSQWDGSRWGESLQLTDNSSGNFTPLVSLDKDGYPWIVWTKWDGVSTSIHCNHWNGKNWSGVTQADDVDIYSDNGPAITIDSDNIPWIVWTGSDGVDDDIYVSHWNGRRWAAPTMINTDNTTPDIMPVISTDKENNIIIVWCGFDGDRYKLFFSKGTKDKWSSPKIVTAGVETLSVDFPNILKSKTGGLELFWYEKNICYKSLWDGSMWSHPEQTEFLLPKDFFKTSSVGPASISWIEDNVYQSLRIIPPKLEETQTACSKYKTREQVVWVKDILCPSLYADTTETRYIAFGDSVTEGVGARDRSTTAYPPVLQNKLNSGIGPSIVVNAGLGGETTAGGLARIDEVLIQNSAQYILILEGINDMTAQWTFETTKFNLGQMIDKAVNSGTTPLIATLPPRTDIVGFRVPYVNAHIEALAQEKGVTLVDQYTEMEKDVVKYMDDSKHPNDAGYELMASNWYNAINALINPSSDDDGGGCGALPPIYRNGRNDMFHNNIFPLLLLAALLIFFRRKKLIFQ